jgi:hypothetical protein
MKRFALLRLWSIRSGRRCVGIVGLLFTLLLISCADGMAQSDQVVARGMKVFFEAWLKRELRGDELRKVTDEFIAFYAKKGKDRAVTHEAARMFLEYAKILREHDGCPQGIAVRHHLIEVNYFDPDMQNTTELRLLLEPDPVRVVARDEKAFMTEQDVVALANLCSFANSNEEPRPKELSRRQIDILTAELDRVFGPNGNWGMLTFFRETAELWAGIRREWPNLSDEEKRKARAYAAEGHMAPMDPTLYGKLLDLDNFYATKHRIDDVNKASVELSVRTESIVQLINTFVRMKRW